MTINKTDLQQLDQRYRATLINSLVGFKTAVLVGSSNGTNGNLAIFNSLTHIGANPAIWGLVFRPATVERHTLNNILQNQAYTINFINAAHYQNAHQTSAKYNGEQSEFSAVGFTELYNNNSTAPFVEEAAIQIAMQLIETVTLKINGTILLLGSLEHIHIKENIVAADGFVALEKANILACTGLDAYYNTTFINRLTYAKPEAWPQAI
jgi:flavin reductase (DIM6/NTAB) family NADH-FMN oxidoreductase RutF